MKQVPDARISIYHETYCSFLNLNFRLLSDEKKLLSIEFLPEKVNTFTTNLLPEPLDMGILFLNNYFNKIKNNIQFEFITYFNNNKSLNKKTLYLDLSTYSEKEIIIYKELIKIKPGQLITYKNLAFKAGIPSGARFVGNTMAKNSFPIFIPCHRVIKSDGTLGNYSSGKIIKEMLIDYEKN